MSKKSNGKVYEGMRAWENVGESIENLSSTKEALKLTGLDWLVNTIPLVAQLPITGLQAVPRKNITYRADTEKVLGVVGDQFTVVDNGTAFALVDDVMKVEQGAKLDSAGALEGGKQVWMLARLPHDVTIPNTTSVIRSYLMIMNAFDGSKKLSARFIPMNLTSNCVMGIDIPGIQGEIALRHTKNVESRMSEAARVLSKAKSYFDSLQQVFNVLVEKQYTRVQMETLVKKIVPIKEDATKTTRTENVQEKILDLYDSSRLVSAFPAIKGTALAAYNAFVEYSDHFKSYKNTKTVTEFENRFLAIIGGSSASFKNEALHMILEEVK